MTGFTPSPEQAEAISAVLGWYNVSGGSFGAGKPFYLSGPAGSGKTTLAQEIARQIGAQGVRYAAFTGKAASVLRSKGCAGASTVHSLCYRPLGEGRAKLAIRQLKKDLGTPGLKAAQRREIEKEIRALREKVRPGFELRERGESGLDGASLLICDEVSMIDEQMAADVLSFEVPVLVLGDEEQLPPVRGQGAFTGREPDFRLEQIHRFALESPVYRMAHAVRSGEPLARGSYGDGSGVWPKARFRDYWAGLSKADQVIVWTNKERSKLNQRIREELGLQGTLAVGEKIICLQNNKELGLLNGEQYRVLSVGEGVVEIEETGTGMKSRVPYWAEVFEGEGSLDAEREVADKDFREQIRRGYFTYGYAITAHRAQGSQWERVVVAQQMGIGGAVERKRWLYTSISRASRSVVVVK